jgi:hypothetical protein
MNNHCELRWPLSSLCQNVNEKQASERQQLDAEEHHTKHVQSLLCVSPAEGLQVNQNQEDAKSLWQPTMSVENQRFGHERC